MDRTLLEQDERFTEAAIDLFSTLVDLVKAELFTGSKKSGEFVPYTLKSGLGAHAFLRALVDAGIVIPLGTCEKKGCRYALPENVKQELNRTAPVEVAKTYDAGLYITLD